MLLGRCAAGGGKGAGAKDGTLTTCMAIIISSVTATQLEHLSVSVVLFFFFDAFFDSAHVQSVATTAATNRRRTSEVCLMVLTQTEKLQVSKCKLGDVTTSSHPR